MILGVLLARWNLHRRRDPEHRFSAPSWSGLSIQRNAGEASVYVACGLAHVSAPGGRVELRAGERATIKAGAAPAVAPAAYWEDWTRGMADQRLAGGTAGAGRIYGVDFFAPRSAARPLEVTRQAVRVAVQSGIAETEVDQTFFNPGERDGRAFKASRKRVELGAGQTDLGL